MLHGGWILRHTQQTTMRYLIILLMLTGCGVTRKLIKSPATIIPDQNQSHVVEPFTKNLLPVNSNELVTNSPDQAFLYIMTLVILSCLLCYSSKLILFVKYLSSRGKSKDQKPRIVLND
mgnify:CR=1 FL=1